MVVYVRDECVEMVVYVSDESVEKGESVVEG
jgi:hypothetical protein